MYGLRSDHALIISSGTYLAKSLLRRALRPSFVPHWLAMFPKVDNAGVNHVPAWAMDAATPSRSRVSSDVKRV